MAYIKVDLTPAVKSHILSQLVAPNDLPLPQIHSKEETV